jgi:hypothetical protein
VKPFLFRDSSTGLGFNILSRVIDIQFDDSYTANTHLYIPDKTPMHDVSLKPTTASSTA